jgi:hypothetical protein
MDINEHMKYLCEDAMLLKKSDDAGKMIAETFILHKTLGTKLKITREAQEKDREMWIARLKKKIPKLLSKTDEFNHEMQDEKYMDICSD